MMIARTSRWIALAGAITLVAIIPWPRASEWFRACYANVCNLTLGSLTFGEGGRLHFRPASGLEREAKEAVSTDTVVQISVDKHPGQLLLGISARRDAFIPALLMLAVIGAAPLPLSRRALVLAAGMALTLSASLVLLYIGVASFFVEHLPSVWQPPPFVQTTVSVAENLMLLPPANRFVFPVVVGLLLVWLARAPNWKPKRRVQNVAKRSRSPSSERRPTRLMTLHRLFTVRVMLIAVALF